MTRNLFLGFFLALVAAGVIVIFWSHEIKYLRPTPIPKNYEAVLPGTKVSAKVIREGKGYFLHFYNPDCPCSRFNARNVKSIIRSYHDSIEMFIVVPNKKALQKAEREFDGQNFLLDENEELAKACGVYSTPQAVIIDKSRALYYRGNYNKARYCTSKATNFAELSLINFLNHQPPLAFGLLAIQSYGCEWDKENKEYVFF